MLKRVAMFALVCVMFSSAVCWAQDSKPLVDANNAFACDLYRQLSSGAAAATQGNIFVSPFSISSALDMTYAGARGSTAAQMRKTLRLGAVEDMYTPGDLLTLPQW